MSLCLKLKTQAVLTKLLVKLGTHMANMTWVLLKS